MLTMKKVASFFTAAVLSVSVSQAVAQGKEFVPDLSKGRQIMEQQCAACHGADGNSVASVYPKIAGQHPEYIYKQLKNYLPQPNGDKPLRENAIMAGFAAMLSDEDKRNVAAYLASEKQTLGQATQKDLLELGEKIYRGGITEKGVPACAGCHSPNGAGIPAQYPRLGGQHAEYTESQLIAWRDGVRRNSEQMTVISSRLSDREIKAVSDYIAGLR